MDQQKKKGDRKGLERRQWKGLREALKGVGKDCEGKNGRGGKEKWGKY